ncbi:MAG TPA: hypothetical protein VIC56_06725 [Gemmatimonadota bacterium]
MRWEPVVFALGVSLACGGGAPEPVPDQDTPARLSSVASQQTGPGEDVPEDFPDDVPFYPGAETVSAVWHPDRGAGSAQLTSTDAPEDVAEWYRERLPEEEWTLGDSEGRSGAIRLPAWKGANQLMVSLEADEPDGGTSIQLNVTRG